MKKTLLYAMLLLLVMTAQAQEKEKKVRMISLYGSVYDSFTKNKLKAHLTLMREDSTVVDTISSRPNKNSNYSYFAFKIPLVEGKLSSEPLPTAMRIFIQTTLLSVSATILVMVYQIYI